MHGANDKVLLTRALMCERTRQGAGFVKNTYTLLCMSSVANKNVALMENICLSTCRAMAPAVSSKQNKTC